MSASKDKKNAKYTNITTITQKKMSAQKYGHFLLLFAVNVTIFYIRIDFFATRPAT